MDEMNHRDATRTSVGTPLVSVVIPTFNRASTLPDAIHSALAQTYDRTEVIVVDDGSTDGTPAVLAQFSDRVVGIHQDNRGASGARNKGVHMARGSILIFLDSDDLLLPNAAERHVAVLSAAGPEVPCSICDLEMRRADGTIERMFQARRLRPGDRQGLWTNVHDVLATRFLFTNQTLAVRRSALDEIGGYDESLWVMEDFDLAMRLGALGPWAYTTEVLAVWNEGTPNSLTTIAHRDRDRLDETVVAICTKLTAEGIPQSRLARRAVAFITRKAMRNLRLRQPQSWSGRAVWRLQRTIEEGVGERLFRRSPAFPSIRASALSAETEAHR